MPRPCGPCQDNDRIELDRRLLEMEISGESFRTISIETGYSESSLKRHKSNHLTVDLSNMRDAMERAKEEALAEARGREMEKTATKAANQVKEGMASRLDNAASFFDQLKILRERAAIALEKAEGAEDLKATLQAIKELRETVKLWAEIDGKLQAHQINVSVDVYSSPQWAEVGRVLAEILEPESPELRQKVALRLLQLAEESKK